LPNEPVWLETAEVIELNRLIVAETGEPFLVRDPGGLESAVGKPRNRWHYEQLDDALTLAVTLLFGIAGNHPFLQGNKRTGFEAALIFLLHNGYALDASLDGASLAGLITDVIAHTMSERDFVARLRPFVRPLPGG
jgi:death-on-curing protein